MAPLEKLLAIEEIKKVKARYWRSMDRRLWDEFERSFTHDCVFDIRLAHVAPEIGSMPTDSDPGFMKDYVLHGARAIRQFVEHMMAGVRSVHQGHIPEIEIDSPTAATAIFPFEDVLDFPVGVSPRHIHGYGHYHEKYRCTAGQWCIAHLVIYRLRVTTTDGELL